MDQMKHFARIISEQRKKKKMTQEALAAVLGISPQAVSKWENGLGLPDVTLFPTLAAALGVSLEELFGIEEQNGEQGGLPGVYGNLPLVAKGERRACYTEKKLLEQNGEKLVFSDGSEADLESGWVTNCGAGEIRIYKMEEISNLRYKKYSNEIKELTQSVSDFDSIHLSIARRCKVHVKKCEDKKGRLEIRANEEFLEFTTVTCENRLLKVVVKSRNHGSNEGEKGELLLWVPFESGKLLHVSLYGNCDAKVEPSFERGELRISGCGTFDLGSFGENLTASIAGSGEIKGKECLGSSKLRISGSGMMKFKRLENVNAGIAGSGVIESNATAGKNEVKVSGSGSLALGEVSGELDVKISGSGELKAEGELDRLRFDVAGSGELHGEGLSVTDAELHSSGNGTIILGRIKGRSCEKLSRRTTLKVAKRG